MSENKTFAVCAIVAFAIAADLAWTHVRTADAYELNQNSSSVGESTNTAPPFEWASIISSFQGLLQGVNAVWLGTGLFPVNPIVALSPQAATSGAQSAAQGFDAWFYSIAGFHIANFLVTMLTIFSWILGTVKTAVDWLIGIL